MLEGTKLKFADGELHDASETVSESFAIIFNSAAGRKLLPLLSEQYQDSKLSIRYDEIVNKINTLSEYVSQNDKRKNIKFDEVIFYYLASEAVALLPNESNSEKEFSEYIDSKALKLLDVFSLEVNNAKKAPKQLFSDMDKETAKIYQGLGAVFADGKITKEEKAHLDRAMVTLGAEIHCTGEFAPNSCKPDISFVTEYGIYEGASEYTCPPVKAPCAVAEKGR